jgi:hypothetical protein
MLHAEPVAIRARLASWFVDSAGKIAAAVRRHPWAIGAFLLLGILAVAPIWRARFLPLLDEPGHVSSVYILRYLKDPSANLTPYYARSFRFVPYLLHYAILWAMSYPLGLEIANKVMQSAYVLSFPLIALWWLRRTRRSPALGLLVFPLAYSYTWAHGFQPFNVGVPFLLMGVCAIDAWLDKRTVGAALGAIALVMLCEVAHPIVFGALCASTAALALAYAHRPLRVMAAALFFAPGLYALKVQIAKSVATPFATAVATSNAKSFDGTWVGWKEMVGNLPIYAMDAISGDIDVWVFWLLAACSLALLLTGLPVGARWQRALAGLHHYRGTLVVAALLACYIALPIHLSKPFDWWFVSGRLAVPLCFFAFLLPSGAIMEERRNLLAPAVIAAAALLIAVGGRYADFGKRMQPLPRLARLIPHSDNALLLSMHPRTDPSVNVEAYREISAWLQVLRGGYTPTGFFQADFPFKVVAPLPGPVWYAHEYFDFQHQGEPWTWVMIHGASPAGVAQSYDPVAQEGNFTLYRRKGK